MAEQAHRIVQIFPDLAAATDVALDLFVRLAPAVAREQGRFSVALSGGNTPSGLYSRLAESPAREVLPWEQIEWCFGDERCVPPDDPESNYGMVKRTLFDRAPVPPANIHRMQGELEPAMAAAAYEQELIALFGLSSGDMPHFDLILLGMGPDGHTASLFPHTDALNVRNRLVVANHVPQLHTDRLTLTLPVLNNGHTIVFLVAGADKVEALQSVLEGAADPTQFPSQAIRPVDGNLIWLVERPAAARLTLAPDWVDS